ncbi:MAG: formylglycine-generating enzyme family protein [Blastocatellia bacterium]
MVDWPVGSDGRRRERRLVVRARHSAPARPRRGPARKGANEPGSRRAATVPGARQNLLHRLGTEAEWEYAARAGTETPFAFGENINPEIVNYGGNRPYGEAPEGVYRGRTVPVGSLGVANGFGLYDMHGNVWEWCSDWYDEKYYAKCKKQGTVIDPQGPGAGSYRVVRGGGWFSNAVGCRSAYRNLADPGYRLGDVGLRLVRVGP